MRLPQEVSSVGYFVNGGFKEYVDRKHYEYGNDVQEFWLECRNIADSFNRYSRSVPNQKKIDAFAEKLPRLRELSSKIPELHEFTELALASYDEFMRNFSNSTPSNAQLNNTDYKLHISLSPESYRSHFNSLVKILQKAITDNTIKHFKRTMPNKISESLEINRAILRDANPIFDSEAIAKANKANPTMERLLQGDQFTIYIPNNYDENKITALCQHIDVALQSLGAQPGAFAAAESPLTSFISFRQDTDEYGEYVEATDIRLKNSQEETPLFIHLKESLTQEPLVPINLDLPTQDQIDANPELFLSDHKPIVADVPLNDNKTLKIVTWNIFGGGHCDFNLDKIHNNLPGMKEIIEEINIVNLQVQEAPSDQKKPLKAKLIALLEAQQAIIQNFNNVRYLKQVEVLKNCNADVILIQEATPESYQIFKDNLGPQWAAIPLGENGATMSFYRKTKYELVNDSITYPRLNEEDIKDSQAFSLLARGEDTPPPIHITNLWGQFPGTDNANFPQRALNIDTLLNKPNIDGGINVVGGDLNIPVGIHTANIPSKCIDAVLYKTPENSPMLCPATNVNSKPNPQLNFYIPGDAWMKNHIIKTIEQQKARISESHTSFLKGSWFLRTGKEKITALNHLQKLIEKAPSGSDYLQIIKSWEDEPTPNNTKTFRDIIHKHRLGREKHPSLTETEKVIDSIKSSIRPHN